MKSLKAVGFNISATTLISLSSIVSGERVASAGGKCIYADNFFSVVQGGAAEILVDSKLFTMDSCIQKGLLASRPLVAFSLHNPIGCYGFPPTNTTRLVDGTGKNQDQMSCILKDKMKAIKDCRLVKPLPKSPLTIADAKGQLVRGLHRDAGLPECILHASQVKNAYGYYLDGGDCYAVVPVASATFTRQTELCLTKKGRNKVWPSTATTTAAPATTSAAAPSRLLAEDESSDEPELEQPVSSDSIDVEEQANDAPSGLAGLASVGETASLDCSCDECEREFPDLFKTDGATPDAMNQYGYAVIGAAGGAALLGVAGVAGFAVWNRKGRGDDEYGDYDYPGDTLVEEEWDQQTPVKAYGY